MLLCWSEELESELSTSTFFSTTWPLREPLSAIESTLDYSSSKLALELLS